MAMVISNLKVAASLYKLIVMASLGPVSPSHTYRQSKCYQPVHWILKSQGWGKRWVRSVFPEQGHPAGQSMGASTHPQAL